MSIFDVSRVRNMDYCLSRISLGKNSTVNRGGFAQGGVKLHRA
jgi:hypothetical protein